MWVSGGLTNEYAQQNESDAETTDAGRVGLAYSVSVAAASTTQFVLEGAYTQEYDVDGNHVFELVILYQPMFPLDLGLISQHLLL